MELRHLDTLLAIAEEGSFTAAADALATVQSNVSDQVRQLEAELGVPLLVRSRKGRRAHRVRRRSCSTARVGSTASSRRCAPTSRCCRGSTRATRASAWSVPRVVGWCPRWSPTCATARPGVRLRVNEGASERLFTELVDGELAQAVVTEPVERPPTRRRAPARGGARRSRRPRRRAARASRCRWRRSPSSRWCCRRIPTRCASRSTAPPRRSGITLDRAGRGRGHPAHRRPRGGRRLRVDPPRDRDPARAAPTCARSPSPACRRVGSQWSARATRSCRSPTRPVRDSVRNLVREARAVARAAARRKYRSRTTRG